MEYIFFLFSFYPFRNARRATRSKKLEALLVFVGPARNELHEQTSWPKRDAELWLHLGSRTQSQSDHTMHARNERDQLLRDDDERRLSLCVVYL
jgi:hypothetical protein